ncbi:phosphatase PAP2 family protein, partial [Aquabacterium sp.]|uniref:phosphatase PAP2 family protein n=1 Tax=Aquabacterium sp. TaxID=1872578 RepID=UPI0025B86F82
MSFDHPAADAQQEATDRLVILVWAGLFFALALFSLLPGLDLLVSAHYYSAEQGFFRRNDPMVLWLYDWTPWIGRVLVLLLALFALLAPLFARQAARQGDSDRAARLRGPWRRTATLAVAVALLGNGLLIEGVFKNTVGRPRPVQTVQFGGTDSYVAPLRLGPAPASHKSWVSSHAAAGFALMGLGLGCGPVWRRRWILIAMVSGGVIGLGRIMLLVS